MFPEACCTHMTPDRMRLRFSLLKGDGSTLGHLAERLVEHPAVERVNVSPVTGSLLLHHRNGAASICRYAVESGLFRVAMPGGSSLADTVVKLYREIDGGLQKGSGGALNLADTSFLALAGAGVWQIARGKFAAPAWYTAFWYAMNIFLKAHKSGKG